jgi:predicted metal-dependent HD superfamily phosphohydrolase
MRWAQEAAAYQGSEDHLNDISAWISSLPAEWIEGCSEPVLTSAYATYQSSGRFYHTWSHVIACVDTLRTFPCDSGRSVFLALLFHDAIYVPGSRENEKESAELASRSLRQHSTLGAGEVAEIHRMILATSDHQVDEAEQSRDLRATIDIDMSILGAPWERYSSYASGVRNEYCPAVTTASRFTAGRIAFLSKVLASRTIFHTPEGVARWEKAARDNVSRELRELKSQQSPLWRAVTAILRLVNRSA